MLSEFRIKMLEPLIVPCTVTCVQAWSLRRYCEETVIAPSTNENLMLQLILQISWEGG